jgi:hypothetical protein
MPRQGDPWIPSPGDDSQAFHLGPLYLSAKQNRFSRADDSFNEAAMQLFQVGCIRILSTTQAKGHHFGGKYAPVAVVRMLIFGR